MSQSTNPCFLVDLTERLAQLDFLLREEECRRIDAEQKYAMLEQEMVSQAMEMEEKLAEMERTYHYRLMEQVIPETAVLSCFRMVCVFVLNLVFPIGFIIFRALFLLQVSNCECWGKTFIFPVI